VGHSGRTQGAVVDVLPTGTVMMIFGFKEAALFCNQLNNWNQNAVS